MILEMESILNVQTVTLVLSLLVGAYLLLRRNPRLKKHIDILGGPPSLPFLGVALSFLRPHHEFLSVFGEWEKRYGTVYGAWIGNLIPYVIISEPNIIEKLVSSTNHIDKGKYDYSLLHGWLGTGLLTAPRNKWSGRRKMLTPSFHFKILEDFMPIFNEQASILVDCIKSDGRDNGESFNIYPYITNCTLDIICETAMGKTINAQTSTANKKYIDAVNGFCKIILDKNTKPWLRIPPIYFLSSISTREKDYLHTLKGFTEQVIQGRKLERAQSGELNVGNKVDISDGVYGKKRKAFLDLLLDTAETDKSLTDSDIREEVDTFMFEGHDTTGVNLGWTVLLLANNQECQKRVHEELDEIFVDDIARDVTTADIAKMKYLECCVKESLRLYPSVPLIMRQVDHDIPLPDGKVIPQGATALLGIYYMHRHQSQFPDPEAFKPERFLLDTPKRHPYSYIPFSAGPRNCIGQKFALMEEKVVLAKLFRNFHFHAVENMKDIREVPDVVLRCDNGINVVVQRRN